MRVELPFFAKILLLFWVPALIYLIVMMYLHQKFMKFAHIPDLSLPPEYQHFVEAIKWYHPSQVGPSSKTLDGFQIKYNPFYRPPVTPSDQGVLTALQPTFMRLSSIMHIEGHKACVINDELYKEGQRIGPYKIIEIGDYYVKMAGPKGSIKIEVGATFTY